MISAKMEAQVRAPVRASEPRGCAKMEAQGEDDAEVDDLDPDADDLDLRLARLEHLMDRCAQCGSNSANCDSY